MDNEEEQHMETRSDSGHVEESADEASNTSSGDGSESNEAEDSGSGSDKESSGSESESEEESESEDAEESETEDTEVEDKVPSTIPFAGRTAFPFCFWYYLPIVDGVDNLTPLPGNNQGQVKQFMSNVNLADKYHLETILKDAPLEILDNVITAVKEVLLMLLDIEDVTVYTIRGSREKDRIRFICPNVWVNTETALNARALILEKLGYKKSAQIIPRLLYQYHMIPDILFERQTDFGIAKTESRQSYVCFLHPEMPTEQLEKKLCSWASYDEASPPSLTNFTERYQEYLQQEKIHPAAEEDSDEEGVGRPKTPGPSEFEEFSTLKEDDPLPFLTPGGIPDKVKKDLGKKVDQCIELFRKYHPDSKLRFVKEYKEGFYKFDFSKSNKECHLCKIKHKSNRQYLIYSSRSCKVFYHCYDLESSDKSIAWSLKKQKPGSTVFTPK